MLNICCLLENRCSACDGSSKAVATSKRRRPFLPTLRFGALYSSESDTEAEVVRCAGVARLDATQQSYVSTGQCHRIVHCIFRLRTFLGCSSSSSLSRSRTHDSGRRIIVFIRSVLDLVDMLVL